MTEQEYNALPGVRRSDLWLMNDSPEKYLYGTTHPAEQTPALVFGSAAHKMFLEPDTWNDEYVIMPQIDRRTKEGKAVWEAFSTENAGKTIVSRDDFDTIKEMGNALLKNSVSREYMFVGHGENETPFSWVDPDTGDACKCKCDRLMLEDGRIVVVDYKTAKSAQTDRFNAEIYKRGYHVQAAMYTEGVRISGGLSYRPRFVFVVQEKEAPYAVNVIEVTEDVMNYGDQVYHQLLGKLHDCKEADIWEGYVEDGVVNEAYLPGWVSLGDEE